MEIIGSGTGSLTGIEEALEVDEDEAQSGFGIIDYAKPFHTHMNGIATLTAAGSTESGTLCAIVTDNWPAGSLILELLLFTKRS